MTMTATRSLVVTLAALALTGCGGDSDSENGATSRTAPVPIAAKLTAEQHVASLVESLNQDVPAIIGGDMRIDNYEGTGNVMVVNVTVLGVLGVDIDRESWVAKDKPDFVNAICASPTFRPPLKAGVTYEHRYRDENGSPVVTVTTNESDCQ